MGSIVKQATGKARRAVLVALAGVVVMAGAFFVERATFQTDLAVATSRVNEAQRAADQIRFADERLTMSANMAASTGEERWIAHYEQALPLIDAAIADALALAPPEVAQRFDAETRVANDRLVALETASFEAVRRGDITTARAILDGPEYSAQKAVLSDGTARFIDGIVGSVESNLGAVRGRALWLFAFILLLSGACSLILWRTVNFSLSRSEVAFLDTERKIQSLAMSDMLTGLANRVSLRHALQMAIERSGANRSKLALLMIDLDRFKPINDRHGHMIGDLVLRQVAERISANLAVERPPRPLRRRRVRRGDRVSRRRRYPAGDRRAADRQAFRPYDL